MSSSNSNRCILLIDDEPDLCRIVKVTLERIKGWKILTAQTGQDGFTLAQTQPLDAILLDLSLPDGNGLEWLQTLKTNSVTRSIPVVLLTAKADSLEVRQYEALGIKGLIGKPFNPLTLHREIAACLNWVL
jgi:DNA-binding response OmpR family regulator